jgi:cell division protein FtsL
MQGPNIGPLADDLYGSLHQIYKKPDAITGHAIFAAPQEHVSKTGVIAMCHIGTSQGTQVMRNFPKLSSTLFATGMAALLLGNLVLPNTAQASLEYSSDSSNSGDKFLTLHNSYGKEVMARSSISVEDVVKLTNTVKTNTTEIDTLKKTISEQARLIEELKRNNGTSSSSSSSEMSNLKRTVSDQDKDLKKLASQVEDLKRSAGSSSSPSSSDLSNLKREVSDQDNQLDQLKRAVEDLSRKVK